MKFHLCLIGLIFLTSWGSLVGANESSEQLTNHENGSNAISDDNTMKGAVSLRGVGQSRSLQVMKDLVENSQLANIKRSHHNIAALTPPEKVSFLRDIGKALEDAGIVLADLKPKDFDETPEQQFIQQHLNYLAEVMKSSKAPLDRMSGYAEESLNDEQVDTEVAETKSGMDGSSYSHHLNGEESSQQQQRQRRVKENQTKSKRQGRKSSRPRQDSESFGGFDHFKKLHDMLGKDHFGFHQSFGNLVHKQKSGAASLFGRRASPHGSSRSRRKLSEVEDKQPMCFQLAKCVDSMSLYDMFAYFKSDDIDKASGEVDSNRVDFDESYLLGKYRTVKDKATEILGYETSRRLLEDSPASTMIKLSLVNDTQCAVTVWQGINDNATLPNGTMGVNEVWLSSNNSAVRSLNLEVSGASCDSLELTRLVLNYNYNERRYRSGEFKKTGVANLQHGYSLYPNLRYEFIFQQPSQNWEDEYWEVLEAYVGPPTSAPTTADFCQAGIKLEHKGDHFCCNSDCITCGGPGCGDRGAGLHECCEGAIDRYCFGPDDTGCKHYVGPSTDSPTISPKPSQSPSQEPTLSSQPSNRPSDFPSVSPSSSPTQEPTVSMNTDLSELCNDLLQEFHRTVENDMAPKWEGGTVGQVCLSEGTQVYAKLGDAAFASTNTSDFESNVWNKVKNYDASASTSKWTGLQDGNGIASLKRIAASDGINNNALDSRGLFYWYDPGQQKWVLSNEGPFAPFVDIDTSSAGKVAIDVNGELFEQHGDYTPRMVKRHNQKLDQVSVGRDGTTWAIERKSGINPLCVRAGGAFNCTIDVCSHDFRSVHVGSKDVIYLLATEDGGASGIYYMYEFQGWKDGIFGKVQCGVTFKKLHGRAKWLSVAVADDGSEKAVYHIGSNDHPYILDLYADRYTSGEGSGPWKQIGIGSFVSISSSGNGQIWAVDAWGRKRRWTGDDLDNIDWASGSTDFTPNQFESDDDEDDKAGFDGVSVAANGDVCFTTYADFHVADGDTCTYHSHCHSGSYCGKDLCGSYKNKCHKKAARGGDCDKYSAGGCSQHSGWDDICESSNCVYSNTVARTCIGDPVETAAVTEKAVFCKEYVGNGVYRNREKQTTTGMPSLVESMDIGLSKEHMFVVGADTGSDKRLYRAEQKWESLFGKRFLGASITSDGWLWVIREDGRIWRWPVDRSAYIEQATGGAQFKKIAAINETHAWGIRSSHGGGVARTSTRGNKAGGGSIDAWFTEPLPSGVHAKEIAAATDGSVWILSEDSNVYRFEHNIDNEYGDAWILENDELKFTDIGVKSSDGAVALDNTAASTAHEYLASVVFFVPLAFAFEDAVEMYAREPLRCAASLFFDGDVRQNSTVIYEASGESSSTPWADEKFVFGSNGGNPGTSPCSPDGDECDMSNYRIPKAIDTEYCATSENNCDHARDEHGQLINNQHASAGFLFTTYGDMIQDYRDCAFTLAAEFDNNLVEALHDVAGEERRKAIFDETVDDFLEELHDKCIGGVFGERIDAGLQLVFGKQPSPGFICGMKEAIIERNHIMPGYCCLDAPHELDGDAWGHPYDCSTATSCQRMGPYLAGMSTDACDVHGGTWCPQPINCTELSDCIQNDIDSYGDDHPAYVSYLDLAPPIRDPTDPKQCGRTKQYLGYHEDFRNNKAICDDLNELRFSKDFSMLNEFFGEDETSGGGTEAGSLDIKPIEVEPIEVEHIDVEDIEFDDFEVEILQVPNLDARTRQDPFQLGDIHYVQSTDQKKERGKNWRSQLAELENGLTAVAAIADTFAAIECQEDTICPYVKMAAYYAARGALLGVEIAFLISDRLYNEGLEMDNDDPYHMYDNIEAIKANMDYTGKYIENRMNEQNSFLQQHHADMGNALIRHHVKMGKGLKAHHKAVGEALEDHHKNIGKALEDHHKNIGDALEDHHENIGDALELHHSRIGNGLEAIHREVAFDLDVEIVANDATSKQVMVLTTLGGSRKHAEITVSTKTGTLGVDEYEREDPQDGIAVISFTATTTETVFVLDALYTDYDTEPFTEYKKSKIVSFGVPVECNCNSGS